MKNFILILTLIRSTTPVPESVRTDIEMSAEDSREEERDRWEIFKSGFSPDMDEIGNAFSN
jgi:hypothetical protein